MTAAPRKVYNPLQEYLLEYADQIMDVYPAGFLKQEVADVSLTKVVAQKWTW